MFHSPWGVLDFQIEGVSLAVLRKNLMLLWSTGLGKSIGGILTASILRDEGSTDLTFIVCESNKLEEWEEDIARFTDLRSRLYRGTKAQRAALREELDSADVWISTYETLRNDIASKRSKRSRALDDGPLLEATTGQRVLVVYDEISQKLRTRTAWTYRAHHHWVSRLRAQHDDVWVLGLTATPVEADVEAYFNQLRVISPDVCPTVGEFNADYVWSRDDFGRVRSHANLSADDFHRTPGVVPLVERFAPALHIKSKDDPDVRSQFPEPVEEWEHLTLQPAQQDAYDAICQLDDGTDNPALVTILRQMAVLPSAITTSTSPLALEITDALGADLLHSLPATKVDRLVEILHRLVGEEGQQVVVFSFYGPSILPAVEARLSAEGIPAVSYHGGVSQKAREANRARFKGGEARVLLSSDAGSRGVNLPEASYVINLDPPSLASTYVQRINRVHRLGAAHDFVHALTLIAKDTVEEGLVRTWMKRNRWSDQMVAASHMTAEERAMAVDLSGAMARPPSP